MSSDYLWDGTGPVDPEVAELEELLSELRYDRDWQPVVQPRRLGAVLAVLAAAAAVAFVIAWNAARHSTSVTGEHAAEPPQNAEAAGAPRLVDPFAGKPKPKPTATNAVINPFKDAPRVAGSAKQPSKLLDPFKDKPPAAPPPPSHHDDLVNPWAAPAQGKSLGASEVAPVVARHRSEVARECWRPARDRASDSAPQSARIALTLRISASGRVASATAGDPAGYPGLGGCVAGRAKRWVFPASASGATVNVPFVFSR